ncbi:MAG: radical SAM protein [Methylocystaceae bacterium]
MIGFTKLLAGTATVSEVIKSREQGGVVPPHLLQFSDELRPLVVWNVTNRCNLSCRHCYIGAEDKSYQNELSTEEAEALVYDLAKMKAPVLLFSGGEPLIRKDIFHLARLATSLGVRPVLSTNGTLINNEMAEKIKASGFQYAGVSLDGAPATHDLFRGRQGAFDQALAGIRACKEADVKTGVRFTINRDNMGDLPELLDIVVREQIPRFCMYHLVYAGRAADMHKQDLNQEEKRQVMTYLINRTLELHEAGVEVEILTTDNHADGIFLYHWLKENRPSRLNEVEDLLTMHGGCSAGTKFANIDPRGNVHPCQFWQDYTVGNIREKPFSELWTSDDPLLVKLRKKAQYVGGQCGKCQHKEVCGGCRIRAREVNGGIWEEDPACYLTVAEMSHK